MEGLNVWILKHRDQNYGIVGNGVSEKRRGFANDNSNEHST